MEFYKPLNASAYDVEEAVAAAADDEDVCESAHAALTHLLLPWRSDDSMFVFGISLSCVLFSSFSRSQLLFLSFRFGFLCVQPRFK